jgi:hypothetical protein
MAAYPDSTPSSSYSDPIYDRLDTVAQAVRRRWMIYVLALLLVIFVSLLIRRQLNNRPDTASAAAFNRAFSGKDEAESTSRFKALAEDESADHYYRARAYVELTQYHLNQDDANTAKSDAGHALSLAREAKDPELVSIAKLSLAAAEYQLQDFRQALSDYDDASNGLGARSPALELEATLGKARAQQSLGELADAASTLEPLLSRSEAAAQQQLDVARLLYWQIKRQLAQPKAAAAPVSASPAAPAAAATVMARPAAVAPAAVPVTSAATPATPAAPAAPAIGAMPAVGAAPAAAASPK